MPSTTICGAKRNRLRRSRKGNPDVGGGAQFSFLPSSSPSLEESLVCLKSVGKGKEGDDREKRGEDRGLPTSSLGPSIAKVSEFLTPSLSLSAIWPDLQY